MQPKKLATCNFKLSTISVVIGGAMLFFSACYKPIPVEKPILEEAKIKFILKDIHLAEALLTETTDRRAKDSLARIYYEHIFQIHQVKKEDFEQSMHAYFTNPAALDSLYQDVIQELEVERRNVMGK